MSPLYFYGFSLPDQAQYPLFDGNAGDAFQRQGIQLQLAAIARADGIQIVGPVSLVVQQHPFAVLDEAAVHSTLNEELGIAVVGKKEE